MDPSLLLKLQKALKSYIETEVLHKSTGGNGSAFPIVLNFQAPDKKFLDELSDDTPAINCYLIGITEDLPRRQSEPSRTQMNATQSSRTHFIEPKFVSLTYMMTVWSKNVTQAAEIEHLIISYLISGLGRFDFFPSEYLAEQDIDLSPYGVRCQLFGNELSEKITGQVWQALGNIPKATLLYSLSVPMPVFEPVQLPIIEEINKLVERK